MSDTRADWSNLTTSNRRPSDPSSNQTPAAIIDCVCYNRRCHETRGTNTMRLHHSLFQLYIYIYIYPAVRVLDARRVTRWSACVLDNPVACGRSYISEIIHSFVCHSYLGHSKWFSGSGAIMRQTNVPCAVDLPGVQRSN